MKYLLLICGERAEPDEAKREEKAVPIVRVRGGQAISACADSWVEDMDARGIRLFGSRVRPPAEATTVRVRDGALLTTDGPYAETKEWMAGFDVIECASLSEAIEVAAKHPAARSGMIEVRQFWAG
jgi:hypothetical protein